MEMGAIILTTSWEVKKTWDEKYRAVKKKYDYIVKDWYLSVLVDSLIKIHQTLYGCLYMENYKDL